MRELTENDSYEQEDPPDTQTLQMEVKRFQHILDLYYGIRKAEVILCLKMYYRLAIQNSDLHDLINVTPGDPIDIIIQKYDSQRVKMTDKEIYGLLTPILNGKHGTNPYNKELLKILVERCFSPLSGTQESI